jgi:hypothetical protein
MTKIGLLALALAAPTLAAAFSGTATLTGTSKVAVPGCGTNRGTFSATVTVAADGTWTAQSTNTVGGTWTPVGRSGRKARFVFDATSLSAISTIVVDDASRLCHAPATLTGVHPHTFILVLNRDSTLARLVIAYGFSGRARGRSGTASYHVAGHGAWIPGS